MYETIRPGNSAMLFKLETTEGVDALPTPDDAILFEGDGYSYNVPFTEEDSNEATGSLVGGAPLIAGQPAEVTVRFRVKGSGVAYTSTAKPTCHSLLASCGMRGVFTAAIAAAALTAGTATSATLGTGFASTGQIYRGLPLVFSAGPGAGRMTFITDYTAGKVATLADNFSTPLDSTTQAAIPANWSYAGTSPADAAARVTDHPSGTLYLYEDGVLHKFTGMRGRFTECGGDTAKPGFITITLMGIYQGESDASVPTVSLPTHPAPTLVQGVNNQNPAFTVNRLPLPIDSWSLDMQAEQESPADPNTNDGFGPSILGKRRPRLQCNPKKSLVSVRSMISEIRASAVYPGLVRFMGSASNRWAMILPTLRPASVAPGTSGALRTEDQRYAATSPGKDSHGRDGDLIITFWN